MHRHREIASQRTNTRTRRSITTLCPSNGCSNRVSSALERSPVHVHILGTVRGKAVAVGLFSRQSGLSVESYSSRLAKGAGPSKGSKVEVGLATAMATLGRALRHLQARRISLLANSGAVGRDRTSRWSNGDLARPAERAEGVHAHVITTPSAAAPTRWRSSSAEGEGPTPNAPHRRTGQGGGEGEERHQDAEKEPLKQWPGGVNPHTGEKGGPAGPEPTRYGDWERKGRVSDF